VSVPRSFRFRLALRFAVTSAILTVLASALGYLALRAFLYQRLDGLVVRLAEIEAAATADSPDESVHFHDAVFLGSGPGDEAILDRYAEVWTRDGRPVLRTRNLGDRDLPLPPAVRDRVVRSGQPELFTFGWQGGSHRAVLYPLGSAGSAHAPYLLQVGASTADTDELLGRALAFLAGLVVAGFGAGAGLGWALAGYAVRPVLEIIHQAETLKAGQPGQRIDVPAEAEELRRLVAVLNRMLERLDAAFEAQRQFLADAGHAIKTPLTVLRGDLDVALRRPRSFDEYRGVLGQSLQDIQDISGLAEDLITLARSDSGALGVALQDLPVEGLLRQVAKTFEGAAARAGVALIIEPCPHLAVRADAALLERALCNLVDNAINYAARQGRVALSAAPAEAGVAVRVRDDGPGIPPAERGRVFERFYRGEAGRRRAAGSGLGLAIAQAIMQRLGGRVEIASEPDCGTTVTLICLAETDSSPRAQPA